MGLLSSLLPIAGSVLGNAFLPGAGTLLGGALGKAVGNISGDAIGSAISGGLAAYGTERRNDQQIASAREQMFFGAREAEKAREFNSGEALKQREWAKYMSDTAHYREVRDLRRAGLNPILSVSKGGPGASTPSGATASGPAATGVQAPILDVVGPAMTTAANVRRTTAESDVAKAREKVVGQELETEKARTQNVWEDTQVKIAERHRLQEELPKIRQETVTSAANEKEIKAQTEHLRATLRGVLNEEEIDDTAYGKIMRYVDRAMRAVGGATNIANTARGRVRR